MVVPSKPDVRWSMDFVSDQLANGRRFRITNVIDDYSRETVCQLAATSISGKKVARFLDQLIESRSAPDQVFCANGTEFPSKAMFFWQKIRNFRAIQASGNFEDSCSKNLRR